MNTLVFSNRFEKDVKLMGKRGYDMQILKDFITLLENSEIIPPEFKPHKLTGTLIGFWEAHLKPDWILIWKQKPEHNEIWLTRTGTHADLFK
jgi:mRNA interferase YafQ